MASRIICELFYALVSSAIFYYFMVYYPRIEQDRVMKDFLIEIYTDTKYSIFGWVSSKLIGKKGINRLKKENMFDFKLIRNYIKVNDIDNLKTDDDLKSLNKNILCELNMLRSALITSLSYSFIRDNAYVFNKLHKIILFIDQYERNFYINIDSNDYKHIFKQFDAFICRFLLGIDNEKGRLDTDDFVDTIKKSYEKTAKYWVSNIYYEIREKLNKFDY